MTAHLSWAKDAEKQRKITKQNQNKTTKTGAIARALFPFSTAYALVGSILPRSIILSPARGAAAAAQAGPPGRCGRFGRSAGMVPVHPADRYGQ